MALGKAFQPPSIYEEDIDPVVLVEVEKGCAAACGFQQIFIAMFAAEDRLDVQSRFLRHVDKLHAQRRSSHRRSRRLWSRPRRGLISLPRIPTRLLRRSLT